MHKLDYNSAFNYSSQIEWLLQIIERNYSRGFFTIPFLNILLENLKNFNKFLINKIPFKLIKSENSLKTSKIHQNEFSNSKRIFLIKKKKKIIFISSANFKHKLINQETFTADKKLQSKISKIFPAVCTHMLA